MYNCSAEGYERVAGLLGEITGTKQSAVLSGEKKIGTTKISGVSIISDKPNENPLNLLDTITDEQAKKAKALVYEPLKKM